jgi:hypothetical protein
VTVNKDMAYRFVEKIRLPCSRFNRLAFVRKELVPGNARTMVLGMCPPAKFPDGNAEDFAGTFLGNPVGNGFVYGGNNGFSDPRLKVAVKRTFEA